MERRYIITGGGTSGHINPALAIAELLKEDAAKNGDSCKIIFTGRKQGLEGELVPKAGYDFRDVESLPMPYKPSFQVFKAMSANRRGKKQCLALINDFKPDCVISTGGYVSAPLIFAAKKAKIPVMIHEANAFTGRANKLFAKDALVITGFPSQEGQKGRTYRQSRKEQLLRQDQRGFQEGTRHRS